MANYQKIALKYHSWGIPVVPTRKDKAPIVKEWQKIPIEQKAEDVKRLFAFDRYAIGFVLPDGHEAIDVDCKNDIEGKLMKRYCDLIKSFAPDLLQRLVIQQTPSGGWHLIYKCMASEGNKKLARAINDETLIETRGKGGQILVYPSPGYDIKQGTLEKIPVITPKERETLHRCAILLDEKKEEPVTHKREKNKITRDAIRETKKEDPFEISTWDDYNDKTDIHDLLIRFGWTHVCKKGDYENYTRPGGTKGNIHGGVHLPTKKFMSFSTSGILAPNDWYNAFGLYAEYEHGGDIAAAARELFKKGFGKKAEAAKKPATRTETKQRQTEEEKVLTALDEVKSTKFDRNSAIENVEAIFKYWSGDDAFKLGAFGSIGAIVGKQKTRKSRVLAGIIASALNNGELFLGFELLTLQKNILWIDTEQPYDQFQRLMHTIYRQTDIRGNSPVFHGYSLRKYGRHERLKIVDALIRDTENLGCIVIDGIVDLCSDFNNVEKSQEVIDYILAWTDETDALLIAVLHLTKTMEYMRGHLGTLLQEKCDFSIEVQKYENTFTVKCRDTRRDRPFEDFNFVHDDYGNPVLPAKVIDMNKPPF